MEDRVQREIWVKASAAEVWEAVTEDGWLAEEARLELWPGGEAWFRCEEGERTGWVEEVLEPGGFGREGRLTFWWASGDQPASRVEIAVTGISDHETRVKVVETRPLEILDLVGMPLSGNGGLRFGPALVAA